MFNRTLKIAAFAGALTLSTYALAHEGHAMEEPGAGFAFDKSHTHILFEVSHLGFSTTYGRFNTFDGTVSFDPAAPEKTAIDVSIKTDSINTGVEKLDEHLVGKDFFNSAVHPDMTFKSTGVTVTGEKTATLTGDLTLLGVTKPVTLDVTLNAIGSHPMKSDLTVAGFNARGMLKRSDFGMTYGVPAVGDEITIVISTELHGTGK